MNQSNSIDSLAIFGSVPRGDSDRFSDRDVLVAADQPDTQIESAFIRAGFSPSIYSWQQLDRLATDGSLFLQHLKQESQIFIDRNDRLNDLLTTYRPRSDYTDRINENLLLFELTNGVPDFPATISWALDVLAVALRNHAILLLAQSGVYLFSYSALIAKLAALHKLTDRESSLLLALRTSKRQYRDHPQTVNATLSELLQTQAVIEKITGANCLSIRLTPSDFVTRLLKLPCDSVHWYNLLRRYEGVYRAMGFVPQIDSTLDLLEIERVFAKPSPYSLTGADSISWVRNRIETLARSWIGAQTLGTE